MNIQALILISMPFVFVFLLVRGALIETPNQKWQCEKCGVVSRRGIWNLHNSKIVHKRKYDRECPVCEEIADFDEVYVSSPLAPRIGIVKCIRMNLLASKNEDTIEVDKQLESYLKVQNKKLELMKINKNKDQTQ